MGSVASVLWASYRLAIPGLPIGEPFLQGLEQNQTSPRRLAHGASEGVLLIWAIKVTHSWRHP